MRAKQLEIIRLRDNNASPAMNMSALIYNLAFSPKIKLIDVTNSLSAGSAATVESCQKLLKISGSIQTLIL
jgi:hypothetical protein